MSTSKPTGDGGDDSFPILVDVTGCMTGKNSALHGKTVKVLETVGKSYVVEDEDGEQHKVQIRATTPSPTKKKKAAISSSSSSSSSSFSTVASNLKMVHISGCKTGKNSVLHGKTVSVLKAVGKSYLVEDETGAHYHVQKRSTMPMWKDNTIGDLPMHDSWAPLLPLPPAVQFWVEDDGVLVEEVGEDSEDSDVSSNYSDESDMENTHLATWWLIAAVRSAYLDERFKIAGRELMACANFILALDKYFCWDTLIAELKKVLAELSEEAKQINTDVNLAGVVKESSMISDVLYNHGWSPVGAAPVTRKDIRQDTLMPSLAAAVSSDYDADWKDQPEHIYIHVLLLVATALNPLFEAALRALQLDGVKFLAAPIKSFTRMINKLLSAEDHRYVTQKPRPAMNIDIVRMLAAAKTPEAIVELVRKVAEAFGGLSYLKCLPELIITDPPAAKARYNMLPVMVTVVFAPEGLTVGNVLKDPEVRAAWAKLRATRPSADVSAEQWESIHDKAVRVLETKCDPNEPVKMHCEVQVVTEDMLEVRHSMHEVYKVLRATNAKQLHADVAKPEVELDFEDYYEIEEALFDASGKGRIATVKQLLDPSGGDGGDDECGVTSGLNVDWTLKDGRHLFTPLYKAAENGHLPVVLELLKHNADPNEAPPNFPLRIAVMNGHVEIVKALLEYNATSLKLDLASFGLKLDLIHSEYKDVVTVLENHKGGGKK